MGLLAGFGLSPAEQDRARRALPTVAGLLSADTAARFTAVALDKVAGVLSLAVPDEMDPVPLISHEVAPDLAVAVFGEVFPHRQRKTGASQVMQAFREGGVECVAQLDGSFGAVVVQLQSQHVWLISDSVGRRTLRWYNSKGRLWVASSDTCLAALTDEPLSVDPVSVASTCCIGWSLGNRSLFHGVESQRPFETPEFVGPHFAVSRVVSHVPLLKPDTPRVPPTRSDVNRLRIEAVTALDEFLDNIWDRTTPIELSLTAGLDSRAALAAIRPHVGVNQLTTRTRGVVGDVEVRTARRLAQICGVQHRVLSVSGNLDGFEHHVRSLAFHRSGDSDAKRCLTRDASFNNTKVINLGGEYGEILRGFYYQGSRGLGRKTTIKWVRHLFQSRFGGIKKYPAEHEEVSRGLEQRLHHELERYEGWSSNGHDILDLFYLYERYANWAMGARMPGDRYRYGLFGAPKLAKLIFRFSAPIGFHANVAEWLIKTRLPEARFLPINGGQFLDTLSSPVAPYADAAARRARKLLARGRRALGFSDNSAAVNFAQGNMMAQLLEQGRHHFTAERSVSLQFLGRRRLTRLVDDHRVYANHSALFGPLWTAEAAVLLARELREKLTSP